MNKTEHKCNYEHKPPVKGMSYGCLLLVVFLVLSQITAVIKTSTTWTGNKLDTIPLPPMPKPCAFSASVLVNDIIYVAGGQESPSSTEALRNFRALDISLREESIGQPAQNMKWEQLEPWPGKARILPVMATQEGDVFLISGARLYKGTDGKATREFLTDCYRYNPQSKRWKRIAEDDEDETLALLARTEFSVGTGIIRNNSEE